MITKDQPASLKKIQKESGVEMLVQGGTIIHGPEGMMPIFEALLTGGKYCIILAPKNDLGKFIENAAFPDKPLNLSDLNLVIGIGPNGSFDLYPVTSGCKMKNSWMVSCEIETAKSDSLKDDVVAICHISNKYIVFPEREEITEISLSII